MPGRCPANLHEFTGIRVSPNRNSLPRNIPIRISQSSVTCPDSNPIPNSSLLKRIHVDKRTTPVELALRNPEVEAMATLCSSLSALSWTRISHAARASALPCQPCASLRVHSVSTSRLLGELGTRKRLLVWPCGARRKLSGAIKTETEVLDDEDLRAGLNETVTEALKVMLAEDDKMLETFKDKVDFLGEFLVQDDQLEAARFMLVLRGMLDHEVYPQNEELQGPYKKAFSTLWCLLEDSGWLLKQPGAEISEVDDEPGEPELEIRFS